MVFDPHRPVTGDVDLGASPEPPHMFRRPADPPPPMGRLIESDAVQSFRAEHARQREQPTHASPRVRARRWAGRLSGRADRRLIFALAEATEAVIERCDAIAARLESQEALAAEIAGSLGSELAHLRAEVGHLRATAASLEKARRG